MCTRKKCCHGGMHVTSLYCLYSSGLSWAFASYVLLTPDSLQSQQIRDKDNRDTSSMFVIVDWTVYYHHHTSLSDGNIGRWCLVLDFVRNLFANRWGDLWDGWPLMSGMKILLAITVLRSYCLSGLATPFRDRRVWPRNSYRPSFNTYPGIVRKQAFRALCIVHVCKHTTCHAVMTD